MLIENEFEAIHVSVSMAVASGLKKKHIANGVEFNMRVSFFFHRFQD